ncbi:hypothetical protein BpHYR1_005861 [Brachionus plicatilis]|uniref:Uncharacterized protein n=1 Tax=Brachionus plicatilis TaxID=10195 RepID=A0A3M7T9N4_BRAPC|nr:hypothetical protein BpHYR1_005861 [Brachionus plicatilis]
MTAKEAIINKFAIALNGAKNFKSLIKQKKISGSKVMHIKISRLNPDDGYRNKNQIDTTKSKLLVRNLNLPGHFESFLHLFFKINSTTSSYPTVLLSISSISSFIFAVTNLAQFNNICIQCIQTKAISHNDIELRANPPFLKAKGIANTPFLYLKFLAFFPALALVLTEAQSLCCCTILDRLEIRTQMQNGFALDNRIHFMLIIFQHNEKVPFFL